MRQRWRAWGVRHRVQAVFLAGGLLLALTTGSTIWLLTRDYLLDSRQVGGVRVAAASASVVDRLLAPEDPDLPRQVQELAGVNESGVLVVRGGQVLAAAGLTRAALPEQLVEQVQAGQRVRQRVRLAGELRLVVGIPLRNDTEYYQALPLRELESSLGRLRLALLVAGASSVLLSLLAARLAVRGALRPVTELTAAAHAVAQGRLDTRMPEEDRDLAAIASVFNATTRDLERRVRESARFAGTVSHELRTPLTTMANAVELLDRRREQLPEVAQEAVQLLRSQLARFQGLLLDLLDIAVVTDGPEGVALEPVDLVQHVRQLAAAESWGPVDAEDGPLLVCADPRRLQRVVVNLVRNAETHGRGLVRIGVLRSGATARLEVDDAGPGVPPQERQRVFERFARGVLGDGAGSPPGVGLGLAFVAELTAQLDGRVSVEDRAPGGARFVVELPLAPA